MSQKVPPTRRGSSTAGPLRSSTFRNYKPMGSLKRRTGALEGYIEGQVRVRFEAEVEALVNLLEAKLTREEFLKFARMVMEAADDNGA